MKKLLVLVIVIAGAWFFRYPLGEALIVPFMQSSQEATVVSTFEEVCMHPVPDTKQIEELAKSKGWQQLSAEEAANLKMTPNTHDVEAWNLPDSAAVATAQDKLSYGNVTTCLVASINSHGWLKNAHDFFALLDFRAKFHLGEPDSQTKISPYIYGYNWTIHKQDKDVRIAAMVLSADIPSDVGYPGVWFIAAVPQ